MSNGPSACSGREAAAPADPRLVEALDEYWESLRRGRSEVLGDDSSGKSAASGARDLVDVLQQLDDVRRMLAYDSQGRSGDEETADIDSLSSQLIEEFSGTERFVLQGRLGCGGMGISIRPLTGTATRPSP
jgi:hypothetical protein